MQQWRDTHTLLREGETHTHRGSVRETQTQEGTDCRVSHTTDNYTLLAHRVTQLLLLLALLLLLELVEYRDSERLSVREALTHRDTHTDGHTDGAHGERERSMILSPLRGNCRPWGRCPNVSVM